MKNIFLLTKFKEIFDNIISFYLSILNTRTFGLYTLRMLIYNNKDIEYNCFIKYKMFLKIL